MTNSGIGTLSDRSPHPNVGCASFLIQAILFLFLVFVGFLNGTLLKRSPTVPPFWGAFPHGKGNGRTTVVSFKSIESWPNQAERRHVGGKKTPKQQKTRNLLPVWHQVRVSRQMFNHHFTPNDNQQYSAIYFFMATRFVFNFRT